MNRETWRKLPFNRSPAGRQLALSESLLAELSGPTLYWYEAAQPAAIMGAAQKPAILDRNACREEGYEVYKRTSGGALVLAGPGFLSLDVALPPASLLANPDITLSYRWFGECWVAALARLGIGSRLVTPGEARAARLALDARPEEARLVKLVCFGTISSFEIVTPGGRKLVGLAQVKRRQGSLFQAGLHLDFPAGQFARLLELDSAGRTKLPGLLDSRAAGLSVLSASPPAFTEIISAFETVLQENWPVTLVEEDWSAGELTRASRLEREKFSKLLPA